MRDLRNAWVCQQRLAIERLKGAGPGATGGEKRPAKPSKHAEKPRKAAVTEDQHEPASRGARKGQAVKRPGLKADAKAVARKPGGKPVGLKGKKKSTSAGNRPLKKRLTLKKGPKDKA